MSDDDTLDPEAARVVAKVRRLMVIATASTFFAVAVVFVVIGYRVFRSEGSAPPVSDVAVQIPQGAKVLSTAIGEGRIAVTVDVNGAAEVLIFDLASHKPLGRIRFTPKP